MVVTPRRRCDGQVVRVEYGWILREVCDHHVQQCGIAPEISYGKKRQIISGMREVSSHNSGAVCRVRLVNRTADGKLGIQL